MESLCVTFFGCRTEKAKGINNGFIIFTNNDDTVMQLGIIVGKNAR